MEELRVEIWGALTSVLCNLSLGCVTCLCWVSLFLLTLGKHFCFAQTTLLQATGWNWLRNPIFCIRNIEIWTIPEEQKWDFWWFDECRKTFARMNFDTHVIIGVKWNQGESHENEILIDYILIECKCMILILQHYDIIFCFCEAPSSIHRIRIHISAKAKINKYKNQIKEISSI